MSDIDASARYWDTANLASGDDVRYWLAVPELRRAVNELLTGDRETLFIQSFLERWRSRWPLGRALSVGCGAGELERGLASLGAVRDVEGIDPGEGSLRHARELAAEASLGECIRYEVVDAVTGMRARLDAGRRYDLLFFHGVLHHVEALEEVLALAGELVRGGDPGLVYVDEYVGPSRGEWTEEHLGFAAGLFGRIAPEHRRTPHVWPPVAMEDPTEMIRAAEIPRLLAQHLEVVERHPYWGNVLNPLVCALRGNALELPEVAAVLRQGLALERWLAERELVEPLYCVYVARAR